MELLIDIVPLSYYQYLNQNRTTKYITAKGKEYKQKIEFELMKAMEDKEMIFDDCKVSISFFFNNKRKNDLDNFTKPVLDFCSDIVFKDDRQIVNLHVKKFYDKERPRILINVDTIDEEFHTINIF